MKVKTTSNDPITFLDHKLGLTDHKGHCYLWGYKLGQGDLSHL